MAISQLDMKAKRSNTLSNFFDLAASKREMSPQEVKLDMQISRKLGNTPKNSNNYDQVEFILCQTTQHLEKRICASRISS